MTKGRPLRVRVGPSVQVASLSLSVRFYNSESESAAGVSIRALEAVTNFNFELEGRRSVRATLAGSDSEVSDSLTVTLSESLALRAALAVVHSGWHWHWHRTDSELKVFITPRICNVVIP